MAESALADAKPLRDDAFSCNRYLSVIWSDAWLASSNVDTSKFAFFDLVRWASAPQSLPGHGSRRLAMSRNGQVVFVAQVSGNVQGPEPTVFRFHPVPAP